MSDLIKQLEYAACGQGPDAEQTLYWRARNEIKRLLAKLSRHCGHFSRTHDADGWYCPECETRGRSSATPNT